MIARFTEFLEERILRALFRNRHNVADFHLRRGNIKTLAVDSDVTVTDNLTRLLPCVCKTKTENNYLWYQGYSVADGDTFKVISGYLSTTSGNVYASGDKKGKSTPWVHSYASGGSGQFTFTFNGSYFTVSY